MHHRYLKLKSHDNSATAKLNRLRAAVLGADDGIVSISGLVIGVAGANGQRSVILAAGVAGIIAGIISMAAGEYVSVSSQRDTERSMIKQEEDELDAEPNKELAELTHIYIKKGLSPATAAMVATELTAKDAYAAHLDAELDIDPSHLVNPWQAAISSAGAFFAGGILPLLAITLSPSHDRIIITFLSTIIALFITGILSAKVGRAPMLRAIVRVMAGGALAMAVTYIIGHFIGLSSL